MGGCPAPLRAHALGTSRRRPGSRGPVLAVRDGDIVEYDIEQRFLRVELPDEEIRRRVEAFDLKIDIPKGFMGIYKQTVGSILKGAVMSGKNVIK